MALALAVTHDPEDSSAGIDEVDDYNVALDVEAHCSAHYSGRQPTSPTSLSALSPARTFTCLYMQSFSR